MKTIQNFHNILKMAFSFEHLLDCCKTSIMFQISYKLGSHRLLLLLLFSLLVLFPYGKQEYETS